MSWIRIVRTSNLKLSLTNVVPVTCKGPKLESEPFYFLSVLVDVKDDLIKLKDMQITLAAISIFSGMGSMYLPLVSGLGEPVLQYRIILLVALVVNLLVLCCWGCLFCCFIYVWPYLLLNGERTQACQSSCSCKTSHPLHTQVT